MSGLVRRALNKRPSLSAIRQQPDSLELVFTCEGSIPLALKEEYPCMRRFLRGAKKEYKKAWTRVLRRAYVGRESPKGKRIRRGFHQYVHELLERALLVLVEQAQALAKSDPGIEEEIRQLREIATGKRGYPKSRRRQHREAIRFAGQYEKLKPQVNALRKFVNKHGSQDDKVVGEAAQKALKYKWLRHVIHGTALKHLPTNSSLVKSKSHLAEDWQAWQLTVAVMYEQQQDSPKRFEPNTINKYVSIGRQLLKKKNQAKPA